MHTTNFLKGNNNKWRGILFLCAVLLISACSSSKIDYNADQQLKRGEGIVFGRFMVMENGKQKPLSSVFGERKLGVTVVPMTSTEAQYSMVESNGFFVWHFPAGEYTLASFDWIQYGVRGMSKGSIYADFSVVADKARYIGDVVINLTGHRYLIYIANEPEEACSTFRNRYPQRSYEVGDEILKLEKRR